MYSYLSSKYLITLFILFAIHSVTSETNHQSDPVHLDVYYESLCPDCSGFIERQLYPTWKLLGNMAGIFTVALYPYGNVSIYLRNHIKDDLEITKCEVGALKNSATTFL